MSVVYIGDKQVDSDFECKYTRHGKKNTRLYNIWSGIKQRCHNLNHTQYKDYGKREICVCNEWRSEFMSFYNWAMSNGYTDKLTIDRVDNDKGYSPENCRWTTQSMQSINQRMKSTNTSGYVGIRWHEDTNKWIAGISYKNKILFQKEYKSKRDAILARDGFIIKNNLPHKLSKEY